MGGKNLENRNRGMGGLGVRELHFGGFEDEVRYGRFGAPENMGARSSLLYCAGTRAWGVCPNDSRKRIKQIKIQKRCFWTENCEI